MCLYGYCRISKKSQSIDRQVRNIKEEYPHSVIIQEAFTGTRGAASAGAGRPYRGKADSGNHRKSA